MKILVFAKQIPEISRIEFDPKTNRIVRDLVPLIINPFDKRAVEEGIRIKERLGGCEVSVASIGPPSAAEILNTSLQMGADRAILVTDPVFAGSDTLITSAAISAMIKKLQPDLVLMGKYSLDGETSQVPPEAAVLAGYDFKSSISKIDFNGDGRLIVEQELENGFNRYAVTLPAVLSVSEKINRARRVDQGSPDRSGDIERWSAADLGTTMRGSDSPTVVESTQRAESKRKVVMLPSLEDALGIVVRGNTEPSASETVRTVNSPDPNYADCAVAVSIGNKQTGYEISSKLCELGSSNGFRVVTVGDSPPDEMEGLPCNQYIYVKGASTKGYAAFLESYIAENRPKFLVFPSNVLGREVSAFIAAKLRLGLTADCVDLQVEQGNLIQFKPAFGGGLVARISSKTSPQMATVRPGIFQPGRMSSVLNTTTVDLSQSYPDNLVSSEYVPSEFSPLQGAKIVIGLGRGLLKKENVARVLQLAAEVGAAVGGTRPIVDMEWLPRQQQIGLTGYSISPDLYLALGVSGQDNHIVGIRYAKKVIAVNKDPLAPIFSHSDYGFVGDAMAFVEALISQVATQHD